MKKTNRRLERLRLNLFYYTRKIVHSSEEKRFITVANFSIPIPRKFLLLLCLQLLCYHQLHMVACLGLRCPFPYPIRVFRAPIQTCLVFKQLPRNKFILIFRKHRPVVGHLLSAKTSTSRAGIFFPCFPPRFLSLLWLPGSGTAFGHWLFSKTVKIYANLISLDTLATEHATVRCLRTFVHSLSPGRTGATIVDRQFISFGIFHSSFMGEMTPYWQT